MDERHRRTDDAPGGGPQRAGVPSPTSSLECTPRSRSARRSCTAPRAGPGSISISRCSTSQIALLAYQNSNYFSTGSPPSASATCNPNIVPYQPFRTKDGSVILACGKRQPLPQILRGRRLPELAADARFASNGKRVENRAELSRLLQAIFLAKTTREWVELLDAAGRRQWGRSTTSPRSSRNRRSRRAA